MNKDLMLDWLCHVAEAGARSLVADAAGCPLEEMLEEVNKRRPVDVPRVPRDRRAAETAVRKHFRDDVTLTSLVLHHYFPGDYFFYRWSTLEPEIFEAFRYFDGFLPPECSLPFDRVGRTGFARYLQLNAALHTLAQVLWPDESDPQWLVSSLLYDAFGGLFTTPTDYNRYWLMVTDCDHESIDRGTDNIWSARKETQAGDLVFMYRVAPVSAVVALYRIASHPWFEPWGPWDGFWAELEPLSPVPPIPFRTLREDPVIGSWTPIRRNLQGCVTNAIPHSVYNRLLTMLPPRLPAKLGLEPEPELEQPRSAGFATEAEFEDAVIEPLLRRWEFRSERQCLCRFRTGTSSYAGRIDFLVTDAHGPVTLFEDKLQVRTDEELDEAAAQARSYALERGLPSFIVASPEALWLYQLRWGRASLVQRIAVAELPTREAELRAAVLRLRDEMR